ncbi:MAG: DUF1573 domain-containing protein [Bacteroidota bacterium]
MKQTKQFHVGLYATALFLLLFVVLTAFDGGVGHPSTQETTSLASQTTTEAAIPLTSVEFEQWTFDFDTVDAGELVEFAYKFKNTGSEPLVVQNIKLHSACLMYDWPREPTPPGGTNEVVIKLDTRRRWGKHVKRASVYTNTDPPRTMLQITGYVRPAKAKSEKN